VSIEAEASAVTVNGARPDRGLTEKLTAGGLSTGARVAVGAGVGAGRQVGAITVGSAASWEGAGAGAATGALASGVVEGEGRGVGVAASTDAVLGRVEDAGGPFKASAVNLGLDDTKNPASRTAMSATIADRGERPRRTR
jgi:hypothetical protein